MTNKTDMVSVPRELLERAVKAGGAGVNAVELVDAWRAVAELKDLLAAPAEDVREVVDEPVACQLYHVTESGLAEGTALGRITVVLVADFERLNAENAALKSELERLNRQKPREYLEHSCTWPSPVCECQACKLKFNK